MPSLLRGRVPIAVAAAVTTLVVIAVAVLLVVPSSDPVSVRTPQGGLVGVAEDGLRSWKGVPYAAPPVGELRFRPPQPAPSWQGERDADEFAPPCLQPAPYEYGEKDLTAWSGSSEDCLYLNVQRPDDGTDGLPVLVYLHGGGFFSGSGALVDPAPLAERGIVVVTVNYRLGKLGFFAHPALRQDVGNLGLLDQVEALTWVRENIEAFGGDPDDVTLMGGSAGAMSVNALMASPRADGLFDKAIAQSAPGDGAARSLASLRRDGARAFPGLSLAELQALPASDLLTSTFNTLRGDAPVLDSVLPRPAAAVFAAGEEAAVPYLVGTTDREFDDQDFAAFDTRPGRMRSDLARDRRIQRAYQGEFRHHVLPDLIFSAPALALAYHHARKAPTFRYRFEAEPGGSHHGVDSAYLFGQVEGQLRAAVGRQMADYFEAFIRTGRPEVDGLPRWPVARETGVLRFTERGPRVSARDPWASRLVALAASVPLQLPR